VVTDLSTPPGAAPKTIRAMLEEHRKNPTCNMCHGVIEPNGLPLERFTVTGQWRDIDWQANAPIDSKVTMPDGSEVDGPARPASLPAAPPRRVRPGADDESS